MTVNATRYLFSFGGTGGAPTATSFANQEVDFYSSSIINGITVGNQNYGTATGRKQTISFDDTPVVSLHQLIAANASGHNVIAYLDFAYRGTRLQLGQPDGNGTILDFGTTPLLAVFSGIRCGAAIDGLFFTLVEVA